MARNKWPFTGVKKPNFQISIFWGFSAIPPPEVPQPSPSPLRHMAAPPMAVAPPVMQAELNPAFLCWPSGANVKRKDPKRLFKAYVDVSENSGTPKSSIKKRVFHYKPSILGYLYFSETPICYMWWFQTLFYFHPLLQEMVQVD